jgi:hypothetical protein
MWRARTRTKKTSLKLERVEKPLSTLLKAFSRLSRLSRRLVAKR